MAEPTLPKIPITPEINYETEAFINTTPETEQPTWKSLAALTKNMSQSLNEVLYQASYYADKGWGSTAVTGGQLTLTLTGDCMPGDEACEMCIRDSAETGQELDPPEGVLPIVATGSERPLFQTITTNIQNNIELDSPMGISVYANSIDQLKGCDIVYDSYMNEFVLGKKRIIVPASMARLTMGADGGNAPLFDPEDTVYYAMPGDRNTDVQDVYKRQTLNSMKSRMAGSAVWSTT